MDGNIRAASWYSSDEPKAVATTRALTDGEFDTVSALHEALRADWFPHEDEFQAAVFAAFEIPARAARPGWEPFDRTRARIFKAAQEILDLSQTDVVLVGHGTAWTLLVSEITGQPPDLDAWRRLEMPDLCTLDLSTGTVVRPWRNWQSACPVGPMP